MLTRHENQQLSLQITESPQKYSMEDISNGQSSQQYVSFLKEKFFASRIQEGLSPSNKKKVDTSHNDFLLDMTTIKKQPKQVIYMTPKNIKESKKKFLQLFSTNNTKRNENDDQSQRSNTSKPSINKATEIQQIMFNQVEIKPEMHSPDFKDTKRSNVSCENGFKDIQREEKIAMIDEVEKSTFQFQFSEPKGAIQLVKPQKRVEGQQSAKTKRKQRLKITKNQINQPQYKPIPSQLDSFQSQSRIKQVFRYCIGCTKAILETNISFHEKQCLQYQKVFNLNLSDLAQYTKAKINALKSEIKANESMLDDRQLINLKEKVSVFVQQTNSIYDNGMLNESYYKQFQKTQQAGRIWCSFIQKVNKLNWFLNLLQRIQKQSKLKK